MASILPIGVENAVCQQAERQLLLGRRLVDASPPVDFFRVIESTHHSPPLNFTECIQNSPLVAMSDFFAHKTRRPGNSRMSSASSLLINSSKSS